MREKLRSNYFSLFFSISFKIQFMREKLMQCSFFSWKSTKIFKTSEYSEYWALQFIAFFHHSQFQATNLALQFIAFFNILKYLAFENKSQWIAMRDLWLEITKGEKMQWIAMLVFQLKIDQNFQNSGHTRKTHVRKMCVVSLNKFCAKKTQVELCFSIFLNFF